jgi:hypothetical protein
MIHASYHLPKPNGNLKSSKVVFLILTPRYGRKDGALTHLWSLDLQLISTASEIHPPNPLSDDRTVQQTHRHTDTHTHTHTHTGHDELGKQWYTKT